LRDSLWGTHFGVLALGDSVWGTQFGGLALGDLLFRDYYIAIQGLLLYLDSFQGLLRCFSGIITVPGFFSGIVTTPLIFLGIITVLIFDLITVLIFDLITVLNFRDYSGEPILHVNRSQRPHREETTLNSNGCLESKILSNDQTLLHSRG
jgi:hypothetical protein